MTLWSFSIWTLSPFSFPLIRLSELANCICSDLHRLKYICDDLKGGHCEKRLADPEACRPSSASSTHSIQTALESCKARNVLLQWICYILNRLLTVHVLNGFHFIKYQTVNNNKKNLFHMAVLDRICQFLLKMSGQHRCCLFHHFFF